MKNTSIIIILILTLIISCKQKTKEETNTTSKKLEFTEIVKKDYELYLPNQEVKAVLILFGGYPEVAEDIKREFKILDLQGKTI